MKIVLPVILLVIIAILAGSLIYEVRQKKVALDSLQKGWEQTIITTCVRDHRDLDRGDVEKVKVDLMLIADVSAQAYEAKYGRETGTKFAANLSEAFAIYDNYQATNRSAK